MYPALITTRVATSTVTGATFSGTRSLLAGDEGARVAKSAIRGGLVFATVAFFIPTLPGLLLSPFVDGFARAVVDRVAPDV